MKKQARIAVVGAKTLIGSALVRELGRSEFTNCVSAEEEEPDLCDARAVDDYFHCLQPDYLFYVGGRSVGIRANEQYPADLMRENLLSQCHVIHSAYRCRVKKVLYLASSCSYPKSCPQPMRPQSLMAGPLEPSNEAYATAKLAGIVMVDAYRQQYRMNGITAIPGDVFGIGDDFSPEYSHVIPALIRKIHQAKRDRGTVVEIWGSGNPLRQFIYADDLANACIYAMQHYHDQSPINLGSGVTLSIREVAHLIKEIIGYTGELRFNTDKPDGMPMKSLDSTRLFSMGWRPKTDVRTALRLTFQWYEETYQAEGDSCPSAFSLCTNDQVRSM